MYYVAPWIELLPKCLQPVFWKIRGLYLRVTGKNKPWFCYEVPGVGYGNIQAIKRKEKSR